MADDEMIGVLLGAKRDDGSLVHRIAMKAGHTRQGSRPPSARLAAPQGGDPRARPGC